MVNHKTLLESEALLISNFGFEIFIPKVIPDSSRFRSGGFTFEFDHLLSLPDSVIQKLNKVDFFESKLSPKTVRLINRYFDAVFVLPYGTSFGEIIRKFEGEIFLRVYGIEGSKQYEKSLIDLYGATIIREVMSKKEKIWFAQAYEELAENEPPVLAERALTLPLGLPNRYWDLQGTHRGTSKKVMFVCPQIATNPFYNEIYRDFKTFIEDIPHVILGVQDIEVDDPNVLGYVTDNELASVYQDSAVLYYPSRNPRHVHFTPIEASVIGLPIVFYEGSLLSRLAPEVKLGRCRNDAEARELITQILRNDQYSPPFALNQKPISDRFTEEYCLTCWHDELRRTLLGSDKVKQEKFWIEVKRFLLMPFLRGRISKYKIPKNPDKWNPDFENAGDSCGATLCAGIDFTMEELPAFLRDFSGLSIVELDGRWSNGKKVRFELDHVLPEIFEVQLEGFAHASNVSETFILRIGRKRQFFTLGDVEHGPRRTSLLVHAMSKSSDIEILIPKPCIVPNDDRLLGVCLQNLKIVPTPVERISRVRRRLSSLHNFFGVLRSEGLRSALGLTFEIVLDIRKFEKSQLSELSLFGAINFQTEVSPAYLIESHGLSWAEPGGRWSDSKYVVLKFSHTLPAKFILEVGGFAHPSNRERNIQVRIANRKKVFAFTNEDNQIVKVTLLFSGVSPTNEIRFRVPSAIKIPNDSRALGIFFSSLKIEDLENKIEVKRFLLMPFLRGRISKYKIPKNPDKWNPDFENAGDSCGATLCAGIDFTMEELPAFLRDFSGLSIVELDGRWSNGKKVRFELDHVLPEIFEVQLEGFAHASNVSETFILRIGRKRQFFTLGDVEHGPRRTSLLVHAMSKSSDIEILIPKPCIVPNDDRLLGVCLQNLKIVPTPVERISRVRRRLSSLHNFFGVLRSEGLRSALGLTFEIVLDIRKFEKSQLSELSLFGAINFQTEVSPAYLIESHGLSWAEPGGRWSDSKYVVLKFSHTLPAKFILEVGGFAHPSNRERNIQVRIANRKKVFAFTNEDNQIVKVTLLFSGVSPTNEIRFRVPSAIKIPNDSRALGIFFSSLKIEDLENKVVY